LFGDVISVEYIISRLGSGDRSASLAGEEYRPTLERFAFFQQDNFLESISYHPSRKIYQPAEEVAKRHNIPFNECIFRGGDGVNFMLLPTTLQREIAEKKLVFIINNLGGRSSFSFFLSFLSFFISFFFSSRLRSHV
jgi:hypothetical protein